MGVARQWTGRLGKVDNCQVAVFGVLTDGERHTPVDMRLYLPKRWIDDPARCERAGDPLDGAHADLEKPACPGHRASAWGEGRLWCQGFQLTPPPVTSAAVLYARGAYDMLESAQTYRLASRGRMSEQFWIDLAGHGSALPKSLEDDCARFRLSAGTRMLLAHAAGINSLKKEELDILFDHGRSRRGG